MITRLGERSTSSSQLSGSPVTGSAQGPGYYRFSGSQAWAPNVNLYETDSAYLICVDLAGVEKEKIDIDLVDRQLTLHGSRAVPAIAPPVQIPESAPRMRIHLMEIDHGVFSRQVEVPNDVQQDKITARYDNGILWIELPKKD